MKPNWDKEAIFLTKIPTPCKDEVEKYLNKWDTTETYRYHDRTLKLLFQDVFPENKKIEHILIKANTLNSFYSAGVRYIEIIPLSKHIHKLNIDDDLQEGKLSLVEKIRKAEDVRDLYSFATKYCSHHNPTAFPIYDSYVEKALWHFKKEDEFYNFKRKELQDYLTFNEVLEEFANFYNLKRSVKYFNIKKLDQYLWQLGKDYPDI